MLPVPAAHFKATLAMYFVKLSLNICLCVVLSRVVAAQAFFPSGPASLQCLKACSQQFCPTAELRCECVDAISNITTCILSTCTENDQRLAGELVAELCNSRSLMSVIANCQQPVQQPPQHPRFRRVCRLSPVIPTPT